MLVTLIVAAISIAGLLAASRMSGAAQPDGRILFAPARGAVKMIPGDPNEVLAAIASGLPHASNAHVATEPIPSEDGGPAKDGLFLAYDLNVLSAQGPDVTQALWEGNILAGAAADEYIARGWGNLSGAIGTLVTPDGHRDVVGGGIGGAVPDQLFDPLPVDILSSVTSGGKQFGLRGISVSKVHGLQEAMVIHAVTDSPSTTADALMRTHGLNAILQGPATRFEGTFLSVTDSNGDSVINMGIAPRAAASTFWVRPGLGGQIIGKNHEASWGGQ